MVEKNLKPKPLTPIFNGFPDRKLRSKSVAQTHTNIYDDLCKSLLDIDLLEGHFGSLTLEESDCIPLSKPICKDTSDIDLNKENSPIEFQEDLMDLSICQLQKCKSLITQKSKKFMKNVKMLKNAKKRLYSNSLKFGIEEPIKNHVKVLCIDKFARKNQKSTDKEHINYPQKNNNLIQIENSETIYNANMLKNHYNRKDNFEVIKVSKIETEPRVDYYTKNKHQDNYDILRDYYNYNFHQSKIPEFKINNKQEFHKHPKKTKEISQPKQPDHNGKKYHMNNPEANFHNKKIFEEDYLLVKNEKEDSEPTLENFLLENFKSSKYLLEEPNYHHRKKEKESEKKSELKIKKLEKCDLLLEERKKTRHNHNNKNINFNNNLININNDNLRMHNTNDFNFFPPQDNPLNDNIRFNLPNRNYADNKYNSTINFQVNPVDNQSIWNNYNYKNNMINGLNNDHCMEQRNYNYNYNYNYNNIHNNNYNTYENTLQDMYQKRFLSQEGIPVNNSLGRNWNERIMEQRMGNNTNYSSNTYHQYNEPFNQEQRRCICNYNRLEVNPSQLRYEMNPNLINSFIPNNNDNLYYNNNIIPNQNRLYSDQQHQLNAQLSHELNGNINYIDGKSSANNYSKNNTKK